MKLHPSLQNKTETNNNISCNKKNIYSLRFTVSFENADVLENLFEKTNCHFVITNNFIKKIFIFERYFHSLAEAKKQKEATINLIKQYLSPSFIKKIRNSIVKIKWENWAESWKKFFHTIHISKRIIIKPSWEPSVRDRSKVIIKLDPGMSFGTGKHPTTRTCLMLIDAITQTHKKISFLDIGCGSGILSIAAAKLGLSPCVALDNDPDAILTAMKNFRKNKVSRKIKLVQTDIASFITDKTFDLIAANILASVLIENAAQITKLTANNGRIILSGILNNEFAHVSSCYKRHGFTQIKKISHGGWTTGLFAKT